jgi:hypothetical protein
MGFWDLFWPFLTALIVLSIVRSAVSALLSSRSSPKKKRKRTALTVSCMQAMLNGSNHVVFVRHLADLAHRELSELNEEEVGFLVRYILQARHALKNPDKKSVPKDVFEGISKQHREAVQFVEHWCFVWKAMDVCFSDKAV